MAGAWFCNIAGKIRGPLAPQDLKALAASGELLPEGLVRQGAEGAWVKAARVKGLFPAGADGAGAAKPGAIDPPATTPKNSAAAKPAPREPGPSPAKTVGGTSGSIAPLPNLAAELDDLGPLPGPSTLPPLPSIAAQSSRTELPRKESPTKEQPRPDPPRMPAVPQGIAVPVGQPVASVPPLASNDAANFAIDDREERAAARQRLSAADLAEAEGQLPSARVMAVAIVGVLFGFVGVCLGFAPIVPIIVGIVAVIMALRAVGMAAVRDTITVGTAMMAVILGLVAGGWGTYSTLTRTDPLRELSQLMNSAVSGRSSGTRGGGGHGNLAPYAAIEEVALVGPWKVQITEVAVGPLPPPDTAPGAPRMVAMGSKPYLLVKMRLDNASKKKLDYTSWSGTVSGGEAPIVQDNAGSSYKRVVGKGGALLGQLRSESFYPGDAKVDLLVFEQPVEGAEYLDLTLPGAAIGEVQPLKFRISKAQIEKLDPPAAPPPKPGEIRSQPEDRK